MSDIRDLIESYYNDVYIEEDQLDEMGQPGAGRVTGSNPNVYRPSSAPYRPGGGRQRANMNRNTTDAAIDKKYDVNNVPADEFAGARKNTRIVAPAPRPLPAGKPNLNVRVTPPGGAGKTAPTRGIVGNDNRTAPSTPTAPQKPAGSAMDQWRAANPKLAAAADEKARIRGTQQTDNPLMKDMRSRLPMNSPSVQSPDVAKLGAGNQSLTQNPNAFKAATPAPSTPSPTTTKTAFDLAKKGVDLSKK